jgi:hypothetical protein
MFAEKNPTVPGVATDDHASFSAQAAAPSKTNGRRGTRFMQLVGSFMLGAIFSASFCRYFFYRELRVAEQKLAAQLTQRIALPGLPSASLPNLIPEGMKPVPTSTPATAAASTPGAIAVSLQPKHVTEKDGPCALFTKEELSQILDTNLTEVTSDSTGCNYKGPARGEWVRYEITWKRGHEALQTRRFAYEELKKRLAPENMPLQFIPNLGEEAYMTLTGILQVRKGNRAVLFNLMFFQDSPARMKVLVDAAFARLE